MPHVRITRGGVDVAGRRRSYTLVAPPDAIPGGPLVLVFHGSGQSGGKFRAFSGGSFDSLATAAGAVVAYLDGYKGQWNDACADSSVGARVEDVDDVAFATAVVGALEVSHRIDRSKVQEAAPIGPVDVPHRRAVPVGTADRGLLRGPQLDRPAAQNAEAAAQCPIPYRIANHLGHRHGLPASRHATGLALHGARRGPHGPRRAARPTRHGPNLQPEHRRGGRGVLRPHTPLNHSRR
ncbi:hypothetical protein AB0C21_06210 [Spirillospora sp. NPDC049024]